ncbi:zinc finger protein 770 [Pseudophryne corroboree]|uniref:zinc finger protein 770 n=1 Tax=Pseudophryne corroboree TaxID=495146 RepID=UPI0030812E21
MHVSPWKPGLLSLHPFGSHVKLKMNLAAVPTSFAEEMLKSQHCRTLKKTPRSRPYSCDACSKQFETPSKLARHYLTHTGQKPFQCRDCSKSFRQMVHLERHTMTHMLLFQCDVCHRHFKNADTFSKHQQLHIKGLRSEGRAAKKSSGARQRNCPSLPVYCFGCQRTFASEEKRLLHRCDFVNVAAHKKPEHPLCEFCSKVFPSRSKLERHLMIHTGQKPFSCALCGKSFRQKTHLKIHQLTHTQEKPFQCNQCYKSFKTPGKLLKHEEVHTSLSNVRRKVRRSRTAPLEVKEESDEVFSVYVIPFQCSSCEQCFETPEILDSHTCLVADTIKTVTCPRKTYNKRSVKQNKTHETYWDYNSELFPMVSEPVGRLMKTEDMGEMGQLDTREPCFQQFSDPRNLAQLHPQQKAKGRGRYQWQPQLHMGGHFQNHQFGIDIHGMLGNINDQSMQSTFCSYESGEPLDEHHTLHHFLHRAQGISLQRDKVSQCDQCDKSFPSISKLRRHYLIHTGQKPFTCTECGKTFRQSAHLKRHLVTHIQKFPLHRSQSGLGDYYSTFGQQQENISYHLPPLTYNPTESIQDLDEVTTIIVPEIKVEIESTDLSIMNHKAKVCKKRRLTAPRDRGTKSHQERPLQKMRTRALPKSYKCSVCTKNFLSPSKLERHYLMHAGQKPFECPECGKSFRQDPHLKRHMLTHIRLKD